MEYRSKVSVIGTGKTAQGTVNYLLQQFADEIDIVLINWWNSDKAFGLAEDFNVASIITQRPVSIEGSGKLEDIADSDVVVLASGKPRKHGQSREDLIGENSSIITYHSERIKEFAPYSNLIIFTNPVDIMTYVAQEITGFDYRKVLGVSGVLDTGRYSYNISQVTGIAPEFIYCGVVGLHGDNMCVLLDGTYVGEEGTQLRQVVSKEKMDEIRLRTISGGARENKRIGGTMYAAGASAATMIKSILKDENSILHCSVAAIGNPYGIEPMQISGQEKYVFIGLPVRLGNQGVTEIIASNTLAREEMAQLINSAEQLKRKIISMYKDTGQLKEQFTTYIPKT